MKKWLVIFLVLIFKFSLAQVDKALLFSHINMKSGLSSNSVRCVLQDSRGFVWIGTDIGLNRFDGKNIKVYKNILNDSTSISSNWIDNMVEDKQGNLWIGHQGGVSKLNLHTDRIINYSFSNIFPKAAQRIGEQKVYIDRNENIWIYGGGLSCYDTKKNIFLTLSDLPAEHATKRSRLMTSVLLDNSNILWITTANGLYSYDIKTKIYSWHPCHTDEVSYQKHGFFTQGLVELNNSELLFTSWDLGLMIYNKTTQKARLYKASDGNSFLYDIKWMGKSERWFNTPYGIKRFDTLMNLKSEWKNDGAALPKIPQTENIYQTKEGIILLGSNTEGLYILNPQAQIFNTYKFPADRNIYKPFNEAGSIHCIGFDEDNMLAGAWYQSGLFMVDNNMKLVKTINSFEKLTATEPCMMTGDMLKDAQGFWWLATFQGLTKVNPKTWDYKTYLPDKNDSLFFRKKRFQIIKEDSKGRLWLVNYKQNFCYFDIQKEKFNYISPQANEPIDIYNLCVTKNDEVWFSNVHELIKYDIEKNTFQKYINPKVNMNTGSIVEGNDHELWVSSNFGLWKFDKLTHKFTNWNSSNGLCNDEVGNMVFDKKGRLWMGTKNGLSAFDSAKKVFYNFHIEDGLPEEEINNTLTLRDNGYIYIGFKNKITWFNPDESIRAVDKYSAYITSCNINGRSQELLMDNNKRLFLSYDQNNFNFQFSIINLDQPAQTIYYYKLEGFDKEWKVSLNGELSYTNLDAGEYTLRVSSNPNKKDDSKDDYLFIIIHPPFWRTWWFIIGSILLIIVSIIVFVARRIHHIKKEADRKTAISQQIADLRMRALRTQMNPHFLFNSLNAIQECCVTGQLDAATQYLAKFSKLVRLILENSDKQWISLSDEIHILKLYLEVESLRFTHSFEYIFENRINEETSLVKIPPMLVQPFVENAIWHGLLKKEGERRLMIRFYIADEKLYIEIEDNGVGRNIESHHEGHKSMGMGIINERIKLLEIMTGAKAEIEIIDKKDEHQKPLGTIIKLSIPLI